MIYLYERTFDNGNGGDSTDLGVVVVPYEMDRRIEEMKALLPGLLGQDAGSFRVILVCPTHFKCSDWWVHDWLSSKIKPDYFTKVSQEVSGLFAYPLTGGVKYYYHLDEAKWNLPLALIEGLLREWAEDAEEYEEWDEPPLVRLVRTELARRKALEPPEVPEATRFERVALI